MPQELQIIRASEFMKPAATPRQRRLRTAVMAVLLPAVLVTFASCASKKPVLNTTVETYQQEGGGSGFGGQTYSTSVTNASTIVSVDAAHRTLELKQADGTTSTYHAGPEVADFAQLRAGDRVKTTLTETRTVGYAKAGTALSDKDYDTLVRPPGGGPLTAINTRTVTAKVLSVSYWDHTVVVQVADGKTMTVTANQYTNLAEVNPGDKVSVKVSQARTFTVEK
jgi:hypothetical protein